MPEHTRRTRAVYMQPESTQSVGFHSKQLPWRSWGQAWLQPCHTSSASQACSDRLIAMLRSVLACNAQIKFIKSLISALHDMVWAGRSAAALSEMRRRDFNGLVTRLHGGLKAPFPHCSAYARRHAKQMIAKSILKPIVGMSVQGGRAQQAFSAFER